MKTASELRKSLDEALKPDTSGKTTPIQRLTPFLRALLDYLQETEAAVFGPGGPCEPMESVADLTTGEIATIPVSKPQAQDGWNLGREIQEQISSEAPMQAVHETVVTAQQLKDSIAEFSKDHSIPEATEAAPPLSKSASGGDSKASA